MAAGCAVSTHANPWGSKKLPQVGFWFFSTASDFLPAQQPPDVVTELLLYQPQPPPPASPSFPGWCFGVNDLSQVMRCSLAPLLGAGVLSIPSGSKRPSLPGRVQLPVWEGSSDPSVRSEWGKTS